MDLLFLAKVDDLLAIIGPTVSVYDLKGRKLKTYKFKSVSTEKTVDVSTLAIAPYVVVIETPQGNVVKYLIKK